MDVFSIVGKITVDYADALDDVEKVSKTAEDTADSLKKVDKSADSAGDSIDKSGDAAKSADSGFTTWKATLANLYSTAITKLISGCEQLASKMVDLTKTAVGNYAEYEQLVGGVETLFKDSSGQLIAYAENAYETAGMSSNEYMDTATSFAASLIQGLGGDTEKAVELTNLAITDMADNANKMGTNISSIQDAYQGFAKQNYTMLDNLKLGYGGTQSEMIRLINDSGILSEKIESLDGITFDQMIAAIHEIQDNLGIAGTTGEEAGTTIQGAWNSVKALFENIMTKVGSELAPTIRTFLNNLHDWLENVDWDAFADRIGEAFQTLFDWVETIDFESFFDAALNGVESFISVLGDIARYVPQVVSLFAQWAPAIAKVTTVVFGVTTAFKLFSAALNANPIALIASLIAGLVTTLVTLWDTNEGFRNAVTAAWETIKTTITTVIEGIQSVISTVLSTIRNLFSNSWNIIKNTVTNTMNTVKTTISNGMSNARSTISSALGNIKSSFSNVWSGIKSTVSNVISGIKSTISSGLNGAGSTVSSVLGSIKSKFGSIWDGCKNVVSNAISRIKSIMNFSWSLPHISLPHFSISGSFSLNPPSIPHIGVSWYKKAMEDGMIMNQPTIFGYNAKSNQFMAGGEAGSETVVGTQNLMTMIKTAVDEENRALLEKVGDVLGILESYLPVLPELANMKLVTDTGVLAGELAPAMNVELGRIYDREERW